MDSWKSLESKTLIDDRWLKLTADRCLLPNGEVVEPYYVLHEHDWVHVFAQAENGEILVVQQFRYAASATCIELPGGVIDSGESSLAAAKRELLEETGYSAGEWELVGTLYANPARQTNTIHIYFASALEKTSQQQLDYSEDIEFHFATVTAIEEMIGSGQFSQALHVASFYRALQVSSRRAAA